MTAETKSYIDMPAEEWGGKCMIYSDAYDKYFEDPNDALEYVRRQGGPYFHEIDDESLAATGELMLTEPSFAFIDENCFYDIMPDDGELPDKVKQAIEAFNESCKDVPVSWIPSGKRLKV